MAISQVDYFLLFVISYVLVGLLTPLMRKVALSQGVLDLPNSAHKSHKNPVPYLGGVAIIIGVVIVSYIALISNKFTWGNFWLATSVLGPKSPTEVHRAEYCRTSRCFYLDIK